MKVTNLRSSQFQAAGQWPKIFPKQVTENYTSSVTFMKQLTVVVVSYITHMRNLFPEDNYIVESFGGDTLRMLKKKCRDELAQFVSAALIQAFEAFDKKYLHQLALCVYEDECKAEKLIEYHIFEYTYHEEEVTMSVHAKTRNSSETVKCTFEDVRQSTIGMIRTYQTIMESCKHEMPSNFDISLRLYYNDQAPEGYQAPGFLRPEEADHLVHDLSQSLGFSCVSTPFHTMTARTYLRANIDNSREVNASQNTPVMSQTDTPFFSGFSRRYGSDNAEGKIYCPCKNYSLDELEDPTEFLTCVYCKTRQHASCFGVLKERIDLVERHCCTYCSEADSARKPTDPFLASLQNKQRKSFCIFRRTLQWCWQEEEMSSAFLESKGISLSGAEKLLRFLRHHLVLPPLNGDSDDLPQEINRDQLQVVMGKFFLHSNERNIGDRLLAETFSSQESRPDPLEEVLSPIAMVSLQNAATIGRVTKPETPPKVEDATLKQYTDVFSTIREEEIPTKGKAKDKRKVDEPTFNLRTGIRTKKARP